MIQMEKSASLKIALVKRLPTILKSFKYQKINPLLDLFKNFSEQSHQIKKNILAALDYLPNDFMTH